MFGFGKRACLALVLLIVSNYLVLLLAFLGLVEGIELALDWLGEGGCLCLFLLGGNEGLGAGLLE